MPEDSTSPQAPVSSTGLVAAAELEKAWREGYTLGYDRGSDDATAYEWGTARGPKTKARNEEYEWNGSETKAATDQAQARSAGSAASAEDGPNV